MDGLSRHLVPVRLAFLPTPHADPDDANVKCHEVGSFMVIMAKGTFAPRTWWRNAVDGSVDPQWHPFERPLANVSHYVEAFSSPGELVVDPFLGGGTSAVACAQLGRRFVGCEVHPAAFQATLDRLRSLGLHDEPA